MRVECTSIEHFLMNLAKAPKVFLDAIYVDKDCEVISEHKTFVSVHASAVVETVDGDQFLLQAGEACGYDFSDQETKLNGSEKAAVLVNEINAFCGTRADPLTILPGKVSE